MKVRRQYEEVEAAESQWGFDTERYTRVQTNYSSEHWSWGDSHHVGTRDNGLREN